jgi:hypothetical protein
MPQVLSGRLSLTDQHAVLEWIALNTDALLAFWEGKIDAAQFAYKLKPLPPHQPDTPKPIWHVRSSW